MAAIRRLAWLAVAVACGCNGGDLPDDWATVKRGDLVLGVDVTGTLKSKNSALIGPPQIPDVWDFKIARMAPEGAKVEEGDMVLAFDFTELGRELERKQNEADSTRTELEKRRADAAMTKRDDQLAIAEAEGALAKAKLKVEQPGDLVSNIEIEEAKLDLKLAESTLEYQKQRAEGLSRQSRYEISFLADRHDRAATRVRDIQGFMGQMRVRAPRAGTVVYVPDWRDEKKKVGDSVWRMQKVLEIVTLDQMMATGDVDEVDASKIAVGQKITLRLDAHQDIEFHGEIKSIVKTVQPQSYKTPLKVVRIDITLDEVDPERMRPGMRFRGTIETGRVGDVILIPTDALFVNDQGPVAYRRKGDGFEAVPLEIGRRGKEQVEVLSGLEVGDQVSRSDLGGARW